MNIEREVQDFVHKGNGLFSRLRSEGDSLSDSGLDILRTQLHMLSVETRRVKRGKLSAKKAAPIEMSACTHGRAIDNYIDENGNRTELFSCLECGAVIKAPPARGDAVAGEAN